MNITVYCISLMNGNIFIQIYNVNLKKIIYLFYIKNRNL